MSLSSPTVKAISNDTLALMETIRVLEAKLETKQDENRRLKALIAKSLVNKRTRGLNTKAKAKVLSEKAKAKALKEKAMEKARKEKAMEKALKEKAKAKALKEKAKEKARKEKAMEKARLKKEKEDAKSKKAAKVSELKALLTEFGIDSKSKSVGVLRKELAMAKKAQKAQKAYLMAEPITAPKIIKTLKEKSDIPADQRSLKFVGHV